MKTNKVAFSGKMCSGKTTMAEYLVEKYGFTRLAIGDQIKKISNMVIEDHKELERYLKEMTPEHANEMLKEFKNYWEEQKNREFIKDGSVYLKNEAYRGMTQKTGDIVRGKYGEKVWIRLVKKEADKVLNSGGKVVCDDVRLLQEKEIFETDGYQVFRLEIEKGDQKNRIIDIYKTYDPKALEHRTETNLDGVFFETEMKINTTTLNKEECFKRVEAKLK